MANPRGNPGNKGNPSPHKARQAFRKARKPGNLQQLQLKLWNAVCCAENILNHATKEDDRELVLDHG